MKLAPQQDQAAKAVKEWLDDPGRKPFFYLAGYAGTGKTTIARVLAEDAGDVVFAAFTGKAALVLQSKGCDPASTIHSLIYKIANPDEPVPIFVLNREDSPVKDADLVIIDEVSMVGEELGRDLLSFGKPILVLGDPEQLPPIGGEGFFTAGEPDFMLTEVHRQAADNPIIRMSMDVREGRRLQAGSYGDSRVISRDILTTPTVLDADQVLVGKNMTRRLYNGRMRKLLGFPEPSFMLNDRVICLKNNKEKGLLNGSIWRVAEIRWQEADETSMVVSPLDAGMVRIPTLVDTHHAWLRGEENALDWREARRYQPFDFAYAVTVHKAQGSQWDNVCLFDESATFREDARKWLYTGITRAAEKVTVVL
jgi:exodeoxyribonuclease-5